MVKQIYIEQHESAGNVGMVLCTKVWNKTVSYDSSLVLSYIELANFKLPDLVRAHVNQLKVREVQKLVAKIWESMENSNG